MSGRRQYGRGFSGGRGGGDRRRRMFTKLIKDDTASIRHASDAKRFLEGMQTYSKKAELIRTLGDERDNGATRIQEALSMIGSSSDVKTILVPMIDQIVNTETAAPLYSPIRNRILMVIFQTPLLLQSLVTWNALSDLTMEEADKVCSFLIILAKTFVEARKSQEVRDLARCLKDRGDLPPTNKLSSILCLDDTSDDSMSHNQGGAGKKRTATGAVCWVSDKIPPGDRHDNDEKNYRDIKLIPTLQELECEQPAWIPLSSGENALIRDPSQRLLDAQFRLLREDAVSTIKENIKEQSRPWHNARIIGINCVSTSHNRKGKPAISSPSFIIQLDPRKGTISWERTRALPKSGIVALCQNGKPIRLGTITIREHEKCSEQWLKAAGGPKIGVTFDHEEDFDDSLKEMAHNKGINDELVKLGGEIMELRSAALLSDQAKRHLDQKQSLRERLLDRLIKYDLLEVSGSFFSYRPILQVLQRMTEIPLAEELVMMRSYGKRPQYLPVKMKMPNVDSFRGYECDLDSWDMDGLLQTTSLDPSQAYALKHALSSRVSLIQGPPGCGKTFIGALIARMIRENTDETILCVCYTNHALDQFLEHLLDNGERHIVRIGGRSKSERLKGFQLRELARNKADLGTEASHRLKSVTAQLYRQHEIIEELIYELNEPLQWTSPNGGASSFLLDEHPLIFNYLSVPTSNNGFELVGPNSKKLQSDYLFKVWVKGDHLPEWIIPALDVGNISEEFEEFWDMDLERRLDMVEQWHGEVMSESRYRLHVEIRSFLDLDEEKQSIMQQKDLAVLEDARVIGATTSGAAQYRDILSMKSSGVVIVEEAGEVLEAHVLASLSEKSQLSEETKHLILIGDHEQLRPKVESYKLQTVSGKGYDLDRSLFERMILSSDLESSMLNVQHRMRQEISSFIRTQTYPALQDHPSVKHHPDVKGVASNVVFIDHDVPEDGTRGAGQDGAHNKTKSNMYEAELSVELVRYFLLQGYRQEQIVVLTPYVGQLLKMIQLMDRNISETTAYVSDLDMAELVDALDSENTRAESTVSGAGEERDNRGKSVRVSSIDNFQGEEADVVIISLVRSNKYGMIGFLKEEQRVNVLLSRARYGIFIIGNSRTLLNSNRGEHVWKPLLEMMKKNGQLLKGLPTVCEKHKHDDPVVLSQPSAFRLKRPNGGCCRPCKYRMECGHVCPQMCHPIDPKHKVAQTRCIEPCRRFPPECQNNHTCPKLCKDKCGPCYAIVGATEIPCGHVVQDPRCHDVRNETARLKLASRCREQVQHTFGVCGHSAETSCSNARSERPICPEECGFELECGHGCRNKCGDCHDGKHDCKMKCERMLFCGHTCERVCHTGPCAPCEKKCEATCDHSSCPKKCNKPCASCVEPCSWHCEHQGQCKLVCGAPCSRLPCNKRCSEMLRCGHRCPSVCGEVCPAPEYCQECCSNDFKSKVVDMILMAPYKDQDLDLDPILVLPCGHFFACTTLDGHMCLSDAYDVDEGGNFTATKKFSPDEKTSKPKVCPDCRCVIQNIKRYGRILRFADIHSLERKHLMAIDRSLDIITRRTDDERSVGKLKDILEKLQKGPMQRVYEACGGSKQIQVPPPPSRPYIRAHLLLSESHRLVIEEAGDINYNLAVKYLQVAIKRAEASESHKSGAQSRLKLVSLLVNWNVMSDGLKEKVLPMLDWIINHHVAFVDLKTEANELKEKIKASDNKKLIAEVVKAMNKVDGYDYGGSWASHWYECPNGHPYFIGNCGMAMQRGTCLECGEAVGGSSHHLLSTNRTVGGVVGDILRDET